MTLHLFSGARSSFATTGLLFVLLVVAPTALARTCGAPGQTLGYGDPSLVNCTHVLGSLSILAVSGLTDLMSFANLESVADVFTISSNPDLISLAGLRKLTSIESLDVATNPKLQSLDGLQNVYNASEIQIRNNSMLADLNGLTGLKYAFRSLEIQYCDSLQSLVGLHNLEAVGSLLIHDNAGLTTTEGIRTLSTASNIYVISCPKLTTLTGFAGVTGQVHVLGLADLPVLTSLTGMERITSIGQPTIFGESTTITGAANAKIADICALCNITLVGTDASNAIPDFTRQATFEGTGAIASWIAAGAYCAKGARPIYCGNITTPASPSTLPSATPTRSSAPTTSPSKGSTASGTPTPKPVSASASSVPGSSASTAPSSSQPVNPSPSRAGASPSSGPATATRTPKKSAGTRAASSSALLCLIALLLLWTR